MKKYIIFIWGCLVYSSAMAQLGNFTLRSANQQLIEEAVMNGFFIVRQNFQLKDTTSAVPAYYGWNNQPHFGTSYSLAIKAPDGYYVTEPALYPWKYDSKFNEYRDNSRYQPVISGTAYRTIQDTVYTSFSFTDLTSRVIRKERIWLIEDDQFQKEGFKEDPTDGLKKGWIVLIVTDNPLDQDDDATVSLVIYRLELLFENETNLYEVVPSTEKQILGGAYLIPQIAGVGEIQFQLAGIVDQKEGKWQVVRLSDGIPASEESGNLTPALPESLITE